MYHGFFVIPFLRYSKAQNNLKTAQTIQILISGFDFFANQIVFFKNFQFEITTVKMNHDLFFIVFLNSMKI